MIKYKDYRSDLLRLDIKLKYIFMNKKDRNKQE